MATCTASFSDVLIGSPPQGFWAGMLNGLSQGATAISGTASYTVPGSTMWITDAEYEACEGPIRSQTINTNCKNCGAAYNRWDDDCNYCGTIRV